MVRIAGLMGLLMLAGSGAPGQEPEVHPGPLVVEGDRTITNSFIVQGDLTVRGDAVLQIDFAGRPTDVFAVFGDVTIEGNGTLWAHSPEGTRGGVFVIANAFNLEHTMLLRDDATLRLERVQMRTQTGESGSVFMSCDARGRARFLVDDAWLETETSWLLANFAGDSTLVTTDTRHIPTEIYIDEASTIAINGPDTHTGLWMRFRSGINTIDLPDSSMPYSWTAGPAAGLGVDWSLTIDNGRAGLGVESYPGSQLTINGRGAPQTGELTIGYFAGPGTEELNGLRVGLQNTTLGEGRLTLSNVHLGPIAWQIYVTHNELLTIRDSVVNEVAVHGTGHVAIEDTLLQLAVLAALGPGSTLDVRRCEVWNQAIMAGADGRITLTDCAIHGSLLDAVEPESRIDVVRGEFLENPTPCDPALPFDIETGQPFCNPFRAPGLPAPTGRGTVTCRETVGCSLPGPTAARWRAWD